MKRVLLSALVTVVAVGMAADSRAILFDLDGDGAGTAVIDVASWDWSQSSALVKGGIPFQAGTNAFTLYNHASLANFTDSSGAVINGTGLNTAFEVTFVGGFGEVGVPVSANTAEFSLDPTNPTNFFQMYWDASRNADNSTDDGDPGGTGFNDGKLIASGEIVFAGGGFTRFNTTTPAVLDQFGGVNSWGTTTTVRGTGGTQLDIVVGKLDVNRNFFIDVPTDLYLALVFNTNNALPFTEVDPANRFWDKLTAAYLIPSIGAVNGLSGPDMLFQVDATTSMNVVPEPGTMVLLGSGLLGLAGAARRRTKT